MARSVASSARAAGMSPEDVARVRRSLDLAMEPRVGTLADDHHPAYLHPGRVALVLLRDAGESSSVTLSVASLLESRDPPLRVPLPRVERMLGSAIAEAVARVPEPTAEDLAERLLALDRAEALAALAERLDHLRHEHLREPVTPWPLLVDETRRVWLPIAERVAPELARRYRHWLRTFERRI